MTLVIILLLIVGAVVAYRYRVPLIAKITGQREKPDPQRLGAAQTPLTTSPRRGLYDVNAKCVPYPSRRPTSCPRW